MADRPHLGTPTAEPVWEICFAQQESECPQAIGFADFQLSRWIFGTFWLGSGFSPNYANSGKRKRFCTSPGENWDADLNAFFLSPRFHHSLRLVSQIRPQADWCWYPQPSSYPGDSLITGRHPSHKELRSVLSNRNVIYRKNVTSRF